MLRPKTTGFTVCPSQKLILAMAKCSDFQCFFFGCNCVGAVIKYSFLFSSTGTLWAQERDKTDFWNTMHFLELVCRVKAHDDYQLAISVAKYMFSQCRLLTNRKSDQTNVWSLQTDSAFFAFLEGLRQRRFQSLRFWVILLRYFVFWSKIIDLDHTGHLRFRLPETACTSGTLSKTDQKPTSVKYD